VAQKGRRGRGLVSEGRRLDIAVTPDCHLGKRFFLNDALGNPRKRLLTAVSGGGLSRRKAGSGEYVVKRARTWAGPVRPQYADLVLTNRD